MPLLDANDLTDAQLAEWIRTAVYDLNHAVGVAYKRELVVTYKVHATEHSNPHLCNPHISVMVMTEVA